MKVSILIVDDDEQKLSEIVAGLEAQVVAIDPEIVTAKNAVEAKRLLRSTQFDLVILDVALPARKDAEIDPSGGIKLLREVLTRNLYHPPKYVIGLTALQDVYQTAASEFAEDLWSLIFYDSASDEWLGRIERKILHIASLIEIKSGESGYESDLCIVCALQEELEPLLKNGWEWEELNVPGDPAIYYEAWVQSKADDLSPKWSRT